MAKKRKKKKKKIIPSFGSLFVWLQKIFSVDHDLSLY